MKLRCFCQIFNESIFYVGTGIFGLAAVICRGSMKDLIKYVGITTITAGTILLFLREKSMKQVGRKNVVFITGCDSGLGYNIAVKCYNLGFTVIAGCLNLKSDGAQNLKTVDTDSRLHLCEIDTTMEEKIYRAYKFVKDVLDERPDYGEFEKKLLVGN